MKKITLIVSLLAFFSLGAHALNRAQIADSADNVTPLLVGHSIPNATVKTASGDPVSLKALTMQKPTIVLFYRGGWCPYCNRQLAGLKAIEKDLVDLGYQVLAVSPETPERLQEQKLETEFAVTLLSDAKLNAVRGFGVGFYLSEETTDVYKNKYKVPLTDEVATGKSVLPAPAVFILDKKGTVKFSYVNPNFKVRLSPELLFQAAKYSL